MVSSGAAEVWKTILYLNGGRSSCTRTPESRVAGDRGDRDAGASIPDATRSRQEDSKESEVTATQVASPHRRGTSCASGSALPG